MSRSIHPAQGDSLPFNHHLHQFLTSLEHERGFAHATIVNRERWLKPFLGWLVAQDVPLSTVSPVVITNASPAPWPAGGSARPSRSMCTLCARSCALPPIEVGARRALPSHRRTPSLHARKSAARALVGTTVRERCFGASNLPSTQAS